MNKAFIFNTKLFLAFSLCFQFISCTNTTPITKTDYMERFELFSLEIKEKCLCKQPHPIADMEKDYINLSQNWFELYYEELTNEDIRKIWAYRGLYFSCKVSTNARDLANTYFQELETYISK